MISQLNRKIVDKIIEALKDRAGFDDLFEELDKETLAEIKYEMADIIEHEVEQYNRDE